MWGGTTNPSVFWGGDGSRGGGGGGGAAPHTQFKGIVVVFAWLSSDQLRCYLDLYSTLGWNSLVCRSSFLDAFSSEKATALAFFVLNELLELGVNALKRGCKVTYFYCTDFQELQHKSCPVVLASFSAGSKACMHKVLQIIQCSGQSRLYSDKYRLVRNCLGGHIFDSSPVDFTSDFGHRFLLPPSILKRHLPAKALSWIVKSVSSGLDTLYLTRFSSQRAEYWNNLHSSVSIGAPYLIICSEDDNLAPYQSVCSFARSLQVYGADVKLVRLPGSTHMGHYKLYPIQYRDAVARLFEKAAAVFSHRIHRLEHERTSIDGRQDEISELICELQNAAVNSNQSLGRVARGPTDHFFQPSASLYESSTSSGSAQDEQDSTTSLSPAGISAHSTLGQMLFDFCVPKNVEGWDIKFSGCLNGQPYASARKLSPIHLTKPMRRSRL